VSYLGSYNPHTKTATIDSEKAAQYLESGAQPSDAAARLLKKEGIKLPIWVNISQSSQRNVRNPEKRRSTSPAQPEAEAAPEPVQAPAEETAPQTPDTPPTAEDTPAEPTAEEPAVAPDTSAEEASQPEDQATAEAPDQKQPEEKA
jgi:small subunit ribosomal protein S16